MEGSGAATVLDVFVVGLNVVQTVCLAWLASGRPIRPGGTKTEDARQEVEPNG